MNMENLSPLNVKCFANMQMILDSLSVSMPKLGSLMDPFYDKFEELLKKNVFPLVTLFLIIGSEEQSML